MRVAREHIPYAIDIIHSFDDYFNPVVPDVINGRTIVDYSTTRVHTYRDSGLQFELTSLPEETSALEGYFRWYRPGPGDVVFDIGAYCGVSAYHFSKLVGNSGHVYAFEPDPRNFASLVRNLARHGLTNVTPIPMAVAGKNGLVTFHSEGALGSSLAASATRAPSGDITEVEAITLAEACKRFGVPAFAKVDIEGAELEMLDAARDLLRSHSIQFAFDTNHGLKGALTAPMTERILRECGYEAISSAEYGFMTTWARKA